MDHLLRLIYISRATETVDTQALEALAEASRTRNAEAGINGILCFGRGYFVQALEGPEDRVMSLYASILRDGRHRQCALLSIGLVSSRAFPHWAMTLVEGEALGPELHARLVDQVLLDRDPSEPVKLLQATLKSLRKAT
jgi:hypothetical protein